MPAPWIEKKNAQNRSTVHSQHPVVCTCAGERLLSPHLNPVSDTEPQLQLSQRHKNLRTKSKKKKKIHQYCYFHYFLKEKKGLRLQAKSLGKKRGGGEGGIEKKDKIGTKKAWEIQKCICESSM